LDYQLMGLLQSVVIQLQLVAVVPQIEVEFGVSEGIRAMEVLSHFRSLNS